MGLLMGHVGDENKPFGHVHVEKRSESTSLMVVGRDQGKGYNREQFDIEFKTELIPALIQKLIEVYVLHCGGTLPEETKEQDNIQARLRVQQQTASLSTTELMLQLYRDVGLVGQDMKVPQRMLEHVCMVANMYGIALDFK